MARRAGNPGIKCPALRWDEEAKCFYCRMPVAKRHEHDHYPIPFRNGGEETVCACINCHDLKDRARFEDHFASFAKAAADLLDRATPMERIWLARLFAMTTDEIVQAATYNAGGLFDRYADPATPQAS